MSNAFYQARLQKYLDNAPVVYGEHRLQRQETTVISVMGAAAIGKRSTIRQILQLGDRGEFNYVPTTTTCQQEEGGQLGDYHHVPENDEGYQHMIGRALTEGIIQGTMHPDGSAYATFTRDYRKPFAVLASPYSDLPKLRAAGFKNVLPIMLLAQPSHFVPRSLQRQRQLSSKPGTYRQILREDRDAYAAALDADDVIWVVNNANATDGDRPLQAARTIMEVARGIQEPQHQKQHRSLAVDLHRYISATYAII